jgi:hypothetical protein
MQFQVPQFIETEDKIVGPFTLRQFIYLAAAGGLSAMLYFTMATWLWLILSLFVFAAGIGLAFVKIEGRPLINIIMAAANFYWKPQTYVWQPEHPKIEVKPKPKGKTSQFEALIQKVAIQKVSEKPVVTREKVAAGSALHKSLQTLQTGERSKESDRQYLERKMESRYQIFHKQTGERRAAKRVDYR